MVINIQRIPNANAIQTNSAVKLTNIRTIPYAVIQKFHAAPVIHGKLTAYAHATVI